MEVLQQTKMIRKYQTKDAASVLNLLTENTPEYFDTSEEKDFENYLKNEVEDYFVYEQNEKIIGAAGINYFPEEKIARLSWDIIAPSCHGKGIGKLLVEYRINLLINNPNIDSIVVRTSQMANQFYKKMGFEIEMIEKDFWAKNFDLYQMKMNVKSSEI